MALLEDGYTLLSRASEVGTSTAVAKLADGLEELIEAASEREREELISLREAFVMLMDARDLEK